VRNVGGFDKPRSFELDLLAEVVEEPHATSEQYRYEIHVYLVENPRPKTLLREARRAHGDVFVSGDRFRFFDRALDAVGDERERRAFIAPSLRNGVGEDEDGGVEGAFAAPSVRNVERPPARDDRAYRRERLAQRSALCFDTMNAIPPLGTTYSVSLLEYQSKRRIPP
jgi:hypothetical protein